MFNFIEIDVVKTTLTMTNNYIEKYPKGVIIVIVIIVVNERLAQYDNKSYLKEDF
jgi:hypothetical protein